VREAIGPDPGTYLRCNSETKEKDKFLLNATSDSLGPAKSKIVAFSSPLRSITSPCEMNNGKKIQFPEFPVILSLPPFAFFLTLSYTAFLFPSFSLSISLCLSLSLSLPSFSHTLSIAGTGSCPEDLIHLLVKILKPHEHNIKKKNINNPGQKKYQKKHSTKIPKKI
jgi:hypothetical protein